MARQRYLVLIRCDDLDPDEAKLFVSASSDEEAEARARVHCTRTFWGTMGNSAFLMDDGPDASRQARREWRDGLTVEVHGLA